MSDDQPTLAQRLIEHADRFEREARDLDAAATMRTAASVMRVTIDLALSVAKLERQVRDLGERVTRREKHRLRLRDAIHAAAAKLWRQLLDDRR